MPCQIWDVERTQIRPQEAKLMGPSALSRKGNAEGESTSESVVRFGASDTESGDSRDLVDDANQR